MIHRGLENPRLCTCPGTLCNILQDRISSFTRSGGRAPKDSGQRHVRRRGLFYEAASLLRRGCGNAASRSLSRPGSVNHPQSATPAIGCASAASCSGRRLHLGLWPRAARRPPRLVGPTACESLRLSEAEEKAKRLVDRGRVRKCRDQVRLKEHDVRAGPVRLKVPAPNTARKVVLGPHIVTIVWVDLWIHRIFALESSLRAH